MQYKRALNVNKTKSECIKETFSAKSLCDDLNIKIPGTITQRFNREI